MSWYSPFECVRSASSDGSLPNSIEAVESPLTPPRLSVVVVTDDWKPLKEVPAPKDVKPVSDLPVDLVWLPDEYG